MQAQEEKVMASLFQQINMFQPPESSSDIQDREINSFRGKDP